MKLTKQEKDLIEAILFYKKLEINMETVIAKRQTSVRQILEPIILNISWAEISRDYFGKSRSWLYQKFTGFDGHSSTDFTDKERQIMKESLLDLSQKIQSCAEKL